MQKLDFVKNLEIIIEKLHSDKVVQIFNQGFEKPTHSYQYEIVRPLLFTVKSNYDNFKFNPNYNQILENLQASQIYSEENLSYISTALGTYSAAAVYGNRRLLDFYNFNRTLITTFVLADNLLLSESLEKSFDETLDEGIIVFQVLISGEGLEPEKYIKILSAIQELVEVLNKIYNENQKPEIILLDSGSDTNIGLKTGIETAKSLFLIFKEIWTFAFSHKHYVQNEKNKSLIESLSVRAEILKKLEEKVITEDEAKEYTHLVKTRTDDLIGLKVLPKQIVNDVDYIENKQRLLEFEGQKLLSE